MRVPRFSPYEDLTVCLRCRSDYVIPVDDAEHDDRHWWLSLRCGQCAALRELVVADATAHRYDLDLARGMAEIGMALERLDREHMAEMAAVFATALQLDLVGADDFAR